MRLLPSAVAHLLRADLCDGDRLAVADARSHHLQAHKGTLRILLLQRKGWGEQDNWTQPGVQLHGGWDSAFSLHRALPSSPFSSSASAMNLFQVEIPEQLIGGRRSLYAVLGAEGEY